jgi:deazaflavin-dependent oxidoreductase (nitroreductase family)
MSLSGRQRRKRRFAVTFWRVANPAARVLAGVVPWWVLVETVGCRTGNRRRTPIAAGPIDDAGTWLIAAHGRHSSWIKNLEATPAVRVRVRRRWRAGTASVHDLDPHRVRSFNRYARQAAGGIGIDPVLVRIDWTG